MRYNYDATNGERYSDNDCPIAPITFGFNELSRYILSDGQPYRAIINYMIDSRDEVVGYLKSNPELCDCNISNHLFAEMLREAADIIDGTKFEDKK